MQPEILKSSGLMAYVYDAASRSMDPRTKIGCAISIRPPRETAARSVLMDYNRTTCGRHPFHFPQFMHKNDYLEHAERLALDHHPARVFGPDATVMLAVNEVPCADCARKIVRSGINEVYISLWWQKHIELHGPAAKNRHKVRVAAALFHMNGVRFYMDPDGVPDARARRDDLEFVPDPSWHEFYHDEQAETLRIARDAMAGGLK